MSLSPLGSSRVAAVDQIFTEENAKALLGKQVPLKLRELNLFGTSKDITHPQTKEAQERSMKWIRTYGQLGPVKIKDFEKVEQYRIGSLLGRAHPQATQELLEIASDFATWLFAYDDIVEKIKDQKLVEGWHNRTLEIINGNKATDKDDGLMQGLSAIISRLELFKPVCSPMWKERFYKDILDYTKATLWEMDNRRGTKYPTVAEYQEHRLKTSGTEIMFRFKELELDEQLSDEIVERVDFKIVFRAAVEIVNIANDIISAPKETEDGMHNLLFVYKNESKTNYQTALNSTVKDLVDALHRFEDNVTRYSGPRKADVEKFFSGLREWDVANFLWSVKDSDRYVKHWSESL